MRSRLPDFRRVRRRRATTQPRRRPPRQQSPASSPEPGYGHQAGRDCSPRGLPVSLAQAPGHQRARLGSAAARRGLRSSSARRLCVGPPRGLWPPEHPISCELCHPEHPLSYEPSGLQTAELSIAVGLANCSRWADAQLHRGWPYTSREGWPFTRQSDPDHEVERVCQDQSMSIHPEAAGHHWPITLSDPSNDARRHEGEHRSLLEVRPIYWQSCLGLVVPGAGRVPPKRTGRLPVSSTRKS